MRSGAKRPLEVDAAVGAPVSALSVPVGRFAPMLARALDVVFPQRCAGCGDGPWPFCERAVASLKALRPAVVRADADDP